MRDHRIQLAAMLLAVPAIFSFATSDCFAQATRDVGRGVGVGGLRQLGSSSGTLNNFRAYSSSLPRGGQSVHVGPLAPGTPNLVRSGSMGGIGRRALIPGTSRALSGANFRPGAASRSLSALGGYGTYGYRASTLGLDATEAGVSLAGQQAARESSESPAIPAQSPNTVDHFSLEDAVADSVQLASGRDRLLAGEYDQALESFRLAMALQSGRPEAEWLAALAEAARGQYGQAVFRLRNALGLYPQLMEIGPDAAGLLPSGKLDEIIAAGQDRPEGQTQPSAEQRIVAAWLALNAERLPVVDSILANTGEISSDAWPAAVAVDRALARRLPRAAAGGEAQKPNEAAPRPQVQPQSDRPAELPLAAAVQPVLPDQLPVIANGFVLGLPPQSAMHRSGRIEPNP